VSLVLNDLTVERGGRAVVKDVSLEITEGQVTALLGPNGAGKSTLVLSVGGVLRPAAGAILLDDANLAGRRPEKIRQAGVAIVPEGRRLLPDLTVEDNLRVASYAHRAVRHRRARPGPPRPHHGGRPDPLLRPGQRTTRQPGPAEVRLPAPRQYDIDDERGRLSAPVQFVMILPGPGRKRA
jgi:ABC-type sugar transport system ATPase subunit